ncbi:MAG: potassium channel family protein [Vulcanimicrobiota bacterium]
MRVIIVGGGEVVFFLARTFLSKGYKVSIINKDPEECEQLARTLKARVTQGDATEPKILEDAGAREAQILITVTSKDYINLVCCQVGSLMFNIPQTLGMVNDPENYEIFKELGINQVFNQTDLIVSMLEKNVGYEFVTYLFTYGGGKAILSEIEIKESMPAANKQIGKLDLPPEARIISVLRNDDFIYNDDNFVLEVDDKALLVTTPDTHAPTLRRLGGKEA